MADAMTTTKTTGAAKAKAPDKDPDAAVVDAVEALREAMLERGDDPATIEAQLHAVKPAETNLVGNLADLQRLGGMVADPDVSNTAALEEAVVIPPTAEVDGEVVEPAKEKK